MLQANSFADIHAQIRACDVTLERMETVLGGFQKNLGSISTAIRTLQDESSAMSLKLQNRQAVSAKVAEFVQNAVISEEMAKQLFHAEVNEAYMEYLTELNKKTEFIRQSHGSPEVALAVKEVEPVLAKLKTKAVAKLREFLMQRIIQLKKPRTNLSMIQHNSLTKVREREREHILTLTFSPPPQFKNANRFLQAHAMPVFEEVQLMYIDTLSKLHTSHFKGYIAGLQKLENPPSSKLDLLGTEPEKLRSWTDKFTSSRQANIFSLGSRDSVLEQMQVDAMVPHECLEKNLHFNFEVLFRSLNKYLLDCCTSEWLFCLDWFGPNDMFMKIFKDALGFCLQYLTTYLKNSFDTVGMLVMLRINAYNKQEMVTRGIPALVPYFQRIDAMIWPRFNEVFALNLQSVKAFQIVPNSQDTRPHFIVRRYAEYATSVLSLTSQFKHPDVIGNLSMLREEILALLDRLAAQVQVENSKERVKKQRIFMMMNLDVIQSLLRDKQIVSTETVVFEDKMEATVSQFVEAELTQYFKPLLVFVANPPRSVNGGGDNNNNKGAAAAATLDKEAASALIKSMHKTWKGDVQHLCQGILAGFSNFNVAGVVCRHILVELTKYWARCWDLIKEAFGPNALSKFYVAPFQIRDEFQANLKMLGDLGMSQ